MPRLLVLTTIILLGSACKRPTSDSDVQTLDSLIDENLPLKVCKGPSIDNRNYKITSLDYDNAKSEQQTSMEGGS